jgi:hypothetical protein
MPLPVLQRIGFLIPVHVADYPLIHLCAASLGVCHLLVRSGAANVVFNKQQVFTAAAAAEAKVLLHSRV